MVELPVIAGAVVAAGAAWALSGFMRSVATSAAPILTWRVHVVLAGVLGGVAGLAGSWVERAVFVVLAVAGSLLTVIDIAEERLPDAIVLPLLGFTALGLTAAAWTTGAWAALARAGIAAAGLFVLCLVMAIFSPDLGFGDVKLAAITGAVGGWFSVGAVLLGFGAAWISFAVVGVMMLLTGSRQRGGSLAFGPFLVLGAVAGVFWAGATLGW